MMACDGAPPKRGGASCGEARGRFVMVWKYLLYCPCDHGQAARGDVVSICCAGNGTGWYRLQCSILADCVEKMRL